MADKTYNEIKAVYDLFTAILELLEPVFRNLGQVPTILDEVSLLRSNFVVFAGALTAIIVLRLIGEVIVNPRRVTEAFYTFLRVVLSNILYPGICLATISITNSLCRAILGQSSLYQFSLTFYDKLLPEEPTANFLRGAWNFVTQTGPEYSFPTVSFYTIVGFVFLAVMVYLGISFYLRSIFIQFLFVVSIFIAPLVSFGDVQSKFWSKWGTLLFQNIMFCIAVRVSTEIVFTLAERENANFGDLLFAVVNLLVIPYAVSQASTLFLNTINNPTPLSQGIRSGVATTSRLIPTPQLK